MWEAELRTHGKENSSVFRLWLKFTWARLLLAFIGVCLNAVTSLILTGYMTEVITKYLEGLETSLPYAFGLVGVVVLGQLIRCFSFTAVLFYGAQSGSRFRSGVIGMTYKKLMKLKTINGRVASEIITIFSSDALRVLMNSQFFVYLLAMPVYLIVGTAYIYSLVDFWCLVTFGTFVTFFIVQVVLIEIISFLRRKTLLWTDIRIRKMNELLSSMKLIKMYAWEESFKHSVLGIRDTETKPLLLSTILNLICNAVIPMSPSLAIVATIALYVTAGNHLTASTAFGIVSTIHFMKIIVSFVPFASRIFGETRISFERIKDFMLEEEFEPPGCDVEDKENAIELRNAVFMWDGEGHNNQSEKSKDSNRHLSMASLALQSVNLTIRRGKHIGICGSVGCGKSSLLQAFIGRMPQITGHIAVDGTVAYAAQQAWIFNGTLRDNVLFGRPYKKELYTKVVHACGLDPDIRLLANGDLTEIGDKGINLSGGQKQRVSLARAVYSESEIYLLDDPLSAVDVHVGQHLFHKCIDKVLKDKTVVLVTHQLQYLKHCDEIYVMDDGKITEHGTHEELLVLHGQYTKVMEQYNSKMDINTADDNSLEDDDSDDDSGDESIAINEMTKQNNVKNSIYTAPTNANHEKGILTDRETSVIGDITMETYKSYINAAGGMIVTLLVLLVYTCTISSVSFSEWWLGIWIKETTETVKSKLSSQNNINDSMENNGTSHNVTTNTTLFSWAMKELQEEKEWYLSVYSYTTLVTVLFTFFKGITVGWVMVRAAVKLHNIAVARVIHAPMRYFDANPTGRLLNRFSRDVEDVDIFLPNLMDNLLQILITIVAALVTTAYNFPLFLIAIVPIGFYFYVVKVMASSSIRNFKRLENVLRSPLINHLTITCNGLSTIVAYHQEKKFIRGCSEHSDATSMALLLFEGSMRWMSLRMDLGGAAVAIVTTITVLFTKGTISPALAALSLSMSIKVSSVIQYFARNINETEARFTSVERIHEYESLVIEKETGSMEVDRRWPNDGRITFSDVLMKYRSDMDPVLHNISVDILPRQKVGIVGRTGAGKSSLAAALFRLTDLSGGHVVIDDVDIESISRKLLRSNLSSIPQDPVLFAGTLRYNLDPFDTFTDAKIWDALDQVHMKEKILLLDLNLELHIEENGENFSVGERQLICLARAILRQNKILVLDEATASIDTSTDAMIQETIRESFSDCTVLTIAHRLNTVLHCDVILVMEAGRLIEMGNPQALMQNPSSHFSNMIRAQTVLSLDS
ncbi:ATP-binding cassette sub-family C member 5-like isoform X1 [Argopecten irradians]|uniref:ATP-binding cassette sub-family C member 5-like isoform X1 n=1 Tax=Argopecten irradians TaxID=31199 RepID=UPI00371CFC62